MIFEECSILPVEKLAHFYFLRTTGTVEVVNSCAKEVHIVVHTLNATFTEYLALEQVLNYLPKHFEDTDISLTLEEKSHQILNKKPTSQTNAPTFVEYMVCARH